MRSLRNGLRDGREEELSSQNGLYSILITFFITPQAISGILIYRMIICLSLAWTVLVYTYGPSVITDKVPFCSQKCLGLNDKLYGHSTSKPSDKWLTTLQSILTLKGMDRFVICCCHCYYLIPREQCWFDADRNQ